MQDIRLHHGHRGVGIDGTLRGGAALPIALNGNPFENTWSGGSETYGPVRLSMGNYVVGDTDLSLPADGPRWNVGRSYNSRQFTSGGSHRDSDGYQGHNWCQTSQPEIVFYDHPTDADKDVLYLVYGADRYVEYGRVDIETGTSDTFKGVNGAAGVFQFEEGGVDVRRHLHPDRSTRERDRLLRLRHRRRARRGPTLEDDRQRRQLRVRRRRHHRR